MKPRVTVLAVACALTATLAFAQPPASPAPPAGQPPAAPAPAAPAAKAPVPFPQDSKIAFVDMNQIAADSAAGKDATKKLKALNDKKVAEITEKNKQLQAAQQKLNTGGSVLNDAARDQLQKDIERMQREIQFAQQNAQAELNEMQQDLQEDFGKKVVPIIQALAEQKGLYAVFTSESGTAYVNPGLDLTSEVVKRLDASTTTVPSK
jgi:Skp family chaperone for outer membrane proteins